MAGILLTGPIVFPAGGISSITGFGFALLSVPVLSPTFGPRVAVPVLVLGFMVGTKMRGKVSQTLFRGIALVLFTLAGVSGLRAGLF